MAGKDKTALLVLQGDGIGPEITRATLTVLRKVDDVLDLGLRFESATIGLDALESRGSTFPDDIMESVAKADGVILGPVSHNVYPPRDQGGLNPSAELRKRLDLYANIRPAGTRKGFSSRCGKDFDLVIVRENTEGFYADRSMFAGPGEYMPTADLALATRKVSRAASMRIARQAFALASTRPAHHVTVVHKANVLRISDGLFLECTREVTREFPDVRYEEQLVDAMAALLVRDPGRFDVVVTTNMFGDILSDLASEIAGSLGLAASLNVGENFAMAQAQHGSAPDIAGQDIANPSSLIGSAAMLLGWIGERRADERFLHAARLIENALNAALENPATRTRDCDGLMGTARFADEVARRIEAGARSGTTA